MNSSATPNPNIHDSCMIDKEPSLTTSMDVSKEIDKIIYAASERGQIHFKIGLTDTPKESRYGDYFNNKRKGDIHFVYRRRKHEEVYNMEKEMIGLFEKRDGCENKGDNQGRIGTSPYHVYVVVSNTNIYTEQELQNQK